MAINAALARVGVTGAAFTAPLGTAIPAAFDAPAAPWVDLGAISEEGLSEGRDEDRQEWTPWQSVSPIRTELTTSTKTFSFTAWETSATTVSLYYQVPVASMTNVAAGTGNVPPAHVTFDEAARPKPDPRAWIFDIFDGDNRRRFILPRAEVTDRGEITYASAELIGYQLTITAYPGSDGVSIRRRFMEGWTAA